MSTRFLPLAALTALAAFAGCSKKASPSNGTLPTSCVGCHGSADNSAPPTSTRGAVATSDRSVGAHATHLNPGAFRKAVSCAECHPVPLGVTSPGHMDGVVQVQFGLIASAGARGTGPTAANAAPQWNASTLTCSAVYCHGGTLETDPVTGLPTAGAGAVKNPVWNVVKGDPNAAGSQVYCGSCHAIPPPAPKHPDVTAFVVGGVVTSSCHACHPGTVKADGTLDIPGGQHIDGVMQIGAAACTQCHGDAARTSGSGNIALAPAPPFAVHPAAVGGSVTATTAVGVGAHQVHLTGTTLSSAPVACSECHLVPTSMLAHPNPAYNMATNAGPVDISWGPLAAAGGAVPRWDRITSPSSPTCASTYCHGGTLEGGTLTKPVWTQVGGALSQVACGTCHGVPPADAAHVSLPAGATCAACHTGYGGKIGDPLSSFTLATLNKAVHIDGTINVGSGIQATCTGCHGDATRSQVWLQPAPPTDLSCLPGTAFPCRTTLVGVGAHQAHLTQTSLSAATVACGECHAAVTRSDHSAGTGRVVDLTFGPLASTGGANPVWNGPARTADQFPAGPAGPDACTGGYCTCATTYCHGATLSGGSNTAPIWTQVGAGQAACRTCHGIPPPAPHTANMDCGTCHTGYTSTTVNLAIHIDGKIDATGGSCTSCHGDPSRTPAGIAAAPPTVANLVGTTIPGPWADPYPTPSDPPGDPGAHLKHLAGALLRAAPIPCAECHTVPLGPPMGSGSGDAHGDGIATVVFGTLANVGSTAPRWSSATLTCSATYCHGGANPEWGGTAVAPVWNVLDGRFSACGSCHGNPPPTTSQTNPVTGQAGTHPDVAATQNCNGCHTGYSGVRGGTIAVNMTLHLNGRVDFSTGTSSCASCHGDPARVRATGQDARVASAPPASAKLGPGATPPWASAEPGAHLAHLVNTNLRTGPIACSECHTVPTAWNATGTTHRNGNADVSFGSLSKTNGLAPTWNTTVLLGCAATYCHGDGMASGGGTLTRPTWNGGSAQAACGTCHANPPPDPTHATLPGATTCASCHTGYGGTVDGTVAATVNKALHLNGVVDATGGSCTSCHGTAARVLVAGADPQTASAPPLVAAPGPYTPDAGADPNNGHSRHLNHALATAISDPIACSECHVTPSGPPAGGADTHGNSLANVVFGALARTGGAAATSFTVAPGAAAPSCGATYCHGGTMQGGTTTAPVWNVLDGTQITCHSCHGMPPTTVARGARSHPTSNGADCGSCHTGYTGTTVNVSLHVNGTVDATFSCTSCHGNSARVLASGADPQTASAPPMPAGTTSSSWWNADLPADPNGVHFRHLNRTTGAVGAHVKCSECHVVPSTGPTGGSDTHGNTVADVAFGTLARTKTGTTAPAPNWTTNPSCSTTYCHGNFTYTPPGSTTANPNSHGLSYNGTAAGGTGAAITWTSQTTSPLACGACHFIPTGNPANNPMPNDTCHPKTTSNPGGFNHSGGNRCQDCHKNASGTATGTATITSVTTHVDGVINGKCTDCHGSNGNGAPWPCRN